MRLSTKFELHDLSEKKPEQLFFRGDSNDISATENKSNQNVTIVDLFGQGTIFTFQNTQR